MHFSAGGIPTATISAVRQPLPPAFDTVDMRPGRTERRANFPLGTAVKEAQASRQCCTRGNGAMSRAIRLSCLLLSTLLPLPAQAHIDAVTSQNYRGYERTDGKGPCCDWLDCRPAFAPAREASGEVIMDRAMNKYPFDRRKVVARPSDDGNWHVCGSGQMIWCIIAPAEARRGPGPADRLFTSLDMRRTHAAGMGSRP